MDPANLDEIKRMTHILEQATNMCDGMEIDFKNIESIKPITVDIKHISLDQTKSIISSPDSPSNYLAGNQYQNTNENLNEKELFEWT